MSNCDLTVMLQAIDDVNNYDLSFCKFVAANDSGETGGHQSGVLINKEPARKLFNQGRNFIKGDNLKIGIKIKWQNDFETDSVFTYYGKGTRNECRITQFGKGFPFFRPENTGDLFVLIQKDPENYHAYCLSTEDEINGFLDAFGMSPTDTGSLIEKDKFNYEAGIDSEIMKFIDSLNVEFPPAVRMAEIAREIYSRFDNRKKSPKIPDDEIIRWINMEYRVFKNLEYKSYSEKVTRGFRDVDEFVEMANRVLNRRKSRAGKSLEYHLAAIFDINSLHYTAQCITEGNKKPDFIFPGTAEYHDLAFLVGDLTFLGAKTTCKDRWRQVINEADRIEIKHLFTLQQGISEKQIDEMTQSNVTLVVPKKYHKAYPKSRQDKLWTLEKFLGYVKEKQNN